MANALGVIPARLLSSRFPRKALVAISGKPMIQWVYEKAKQCTHLNDVIVATDSEEIETVVKSFSGQVIMTSTEHPTGLDRVIEVQQHLPQYSHYINIQGDEPLIHTSTIDGVVSLFSQNKNCDITTAAVRFDNYTDLLNPNNVKVVFDKDKRALYFSRSPLPYIKDKSEFNNHDFFKHLGIYGYSKQLLETVKQYKPASLETQERLEQLRFLYYNKNIFIHIAENDSIGVDVVEDVKRVEQLLAKQN